MDTIRAGDTVAYQSHGRTVWATVLVVTSTTLLVRRRDGIEDWCWIEEATRA